MRTFNFFFAGTIAAIVSIVAMAPSNSAYAAHARHPSQTRPARHAPASQPAASVPLSSIHVFGDHPAPFALDAKAAMLIDARTGAVLYSYNEHQKMQPASLAKIMTFYLALEALDQKRITLDTQATISEAAWRLSMDESVSRMFLGVGQKVPVQQLLYGLMVSSGNDAAIALAEYLGGSSDGFTTQMNEKARQLGLDETHFANPDGLPAENEYTTASDMVKLGRALLTRFPNATTYTGAREYTFDKITQRNFNTLLFYDPRVNGIKTGHVAEAGFHLVASANAEGMSLISAVMGSTSMEKRRVETKKLLDWAFRTFATAHPDLSKIVPSAMPVYQGVVDSVKIGPASDSYVTVERGKENAVTASYAPKAKYFVAPVAKGDAVGEITVMQDGKPIATIPAVTDAAVARGGFLKRLRDRIRLML